MARGTKQRNRYLQRAALDSRPHHHRNNTAEPIDAVHWQELLQSMQDALHITTPLAVCVMTLVLSFRAEES